MTSDHRNAEGTTRRQLLAGSAAMGAALMLGATGSARAAQTGGRLAIGMEDGATSDSLDPRTTTSVTMGTANYSFGNCLTEVGEDFKLVPELATGWESDKAVKRWTFDLRQGVSFHNGKDFTAADAIWSLNLHRGKDSTSGAKALLDPIVSIKADGKHRLVIELAEGNVDLPALLSDFHLIILPENTTDFTAGIGTGAYQLANFEPGVSFKATRNRSYWKEGRGLVDEIEILTVADASARASGLLSGELQLANRIDSRTADRFKSAPGVQVFASAGPGHRPVNMLCDVSPFDSNDIRLAIKYALNRKEILEKTAAGYGVIGNDHPIPPFDPMFSKEIPQREQDLDKARFHFKKAGYSGTPLLLHASQATHAEALDMAALIREQLAAAGIAVEIKQDPADGYWTDVWMKEPFSIASWGGRPTADIMLSTAYKSDAAWNDTHWRNEKFDQLLVQARAELDQGKRREIYHDLQLMVRDTGGAAITYFSDVIDGASDKVRGYFPGGYDLSGMRAAERCWLES
jgi:peptide/nickel transport system substrate-binding protein